jgi:hypothetical protein
LIRFLLINTMVLPYLVDKTISLSTRSPTGLIVELEHLKIKTRLTNEKFASVKVECQI